MEESKKYGMTYKFDFGTFFIMEENGKLLEVSYVQPYVKKAQKVQNVSEHLGKVKKKTQSYVEQETPVLKKTVEELKEYFAGERKNFDIPLAPVGTKFQNQVWAALCTIPYGETRSYKDIAVQIGNEKACRAVGMANNRNPIMIIIPCHRVIGANGKLVGYGGGLDVKEALLNLERGKL